MKKHFLELRQLHGFLFYSIAGIVLLSSCKKNKNDTYPAAPKTKLISAVYINDTISEKYHYKSNRQLIKTERFNKGNLDGIWNYAYDMAGNLSSSISTKPDGSIRTKQEYSWNTAEQLVQSKFANFAFGYFSFFEFIYDASVKNQMVGYIESDTLGNKNNKVDYFYTGGFLSGVNYHQIYPTGETVMYSSSIHQTTTDVTQLKRYKEIISSIPNTSPDNWLNAQITEFYKTYKYTSGEMTNEQRIELTEKQYDAKGYVTGLKMTIKKIKPVGPDIVTRLRYEYVEL